MKAQKTQLQGPIAKVRRIVKHGHSFCISIPLPFIKLHNRQKGEKVPVIYNHILKIVPNEGGITWNKNDGHYSNVRDADSAVRR